MDSSLELVGISYLQVLSKQLSCMLSSFSSSFFCKSMSHSGCSALYVVNPYFFLNKMLKND